MFCRWAGGASPVGGSCGRLVGDPALLATLATAVRVRRLQSLRPARGDRCGPVGDQPDSRPRRRGRADALLGQARSTARARRPWLGHAWVRFERRWFATHPEARRMRCDAPVTWSTGTDGRATGDARRPEAGALMRRARPARSPTLAAAHCRGDAGRPDDHRRGVPPRGRRGCLTSCWLHPAPLVGLVGRVGTAPLSSESTGSLRRATSRYRRSRAGLSLSGLSASSARVAALTSWPGHGPAAASPRWPASRPAPAAAGRVRAPTMPTARPASPSSWSSAFRQWQVSLWGQRRSRRRWPSAGRGRRCSCAVRPRPPCGGSVSQVLTASRSSRRASASESWSRSATLSALGVQSWLGRAEMTRIAVTRA